MTISLVVNDEACEVEIDTRASLALLLRDALELTGTHIGCNTGNCGACTVELDGCIVKSCCVLAPEADGCTVRTVEGLAAVPTKLHPVQQAFVDEQALQCGFCTPGMIMAVIDLLKHNPNPTVGDIRYGLAGNLCRCTGYSNIFRAVRTAAALLAQSGQAPTHAEEIS
jgi:carbon-monoxide dehydrogenase small subunit